MKKIITIILSFLLITPYTMGQSKCLTDQYYQKLKDGNPDLKAKEELFNQSASSPDLNKKGTHYIIPIVFHVLHNNGTENISRDQILDQIRIMNLDFNRQNNDTNKTRSIFKGIAANCDVEFRLATRDPFGNCTEGINRIETILTENATDDIKAVYGWPRDRYYNVWVVKSINSSSSGIGVIAGYAHFPWSGLSFNDGVVIRADYVGSIGTATGNTSHGRVLTHESGHWLGLYHTFQDSCKAGDLVADTPPVKAPSFNVCLPSIVNSCHTDDPDLIDQYENYMDYSNGVCQNMYTNGQKARIVATLTGIRSSMVTQANLERTGVLNPIPMSACVPKAQFTTQGLKSICEGASVNYKDISYNYTGSITYNWTFEDGTPSNSTIANPVVTYSNAGYHKVTMIVSNSNGNDTFISNQYVKVFPKNVVGNSFNQGFEVSNLGDIYWDFKSTEAQSWQLSDIPFEGTHSLFIDNEKSKGDNVYSMITNQINLSSNSVPLTFYYAFTPRDVSDPGEAPVISNDDLSIYASYNCGTNWSRLSKTSGTNLMTTTAVSSNKNALFEPKSDEFWKKKTVSLSSISSANLKNVMFKFEFISAGGNDIFIDNIGLGDFLGTSAIANDKVRIYPNPASTSINISLSTIVKGNSNIVISDISGRRISSAVSNSFPFDMDITSLTNGIYLVSIETETGINFTKRLQVLK